MGYPEVIRITHCPRDKVAVAGTGYFFDINAITSGCKEFSV